MTIFEALRISHDRQREYIDAVLLTKGDSEERRFFQMAGKLLSDKQKAELATQYNREFEQLQCLSSFGARLSWSWAWKRSEWTRAPYGCAPRLWPDTWLDRPPSSLSLILIPDWGGRFYLHRAGRYGLPWALSHWPNK